MQAGLRTINCVLAMKRRENEPEQMAQIGMPYTETLRMLQEETMTETRFGKGRKLQKFKGKQLQKVV